MHRITNARDYVRAFGVVSVLALVSWGGVAAADCPSGDAWCTESNAWSSWDRIASIYPHPDGLAFTMANINSPDGTCNGGRQFILPSSDANYDVKARALMLAFSAGREVKLVPTVAHNGWTCMIVVDRFQVR